MAMNGEINLRLTYRAIAPVLALLVCAWLVFHATHILVVLFLAILVAAAASTAANRLARFRVPRAVAILLTYLVIVLCLAGIVSLIVPLLVEEVTLLRDNFPRYEDQANALLARLPRQGATPCASTIWRRPSSPTRRPPRATADADCVTWGARS